MLTFKNILVPVDFTETSKKALDYAVELAKRFDSKITVLHAYEIPVFGFPDGALIATADIASRIANAAQQSLAATVDARKSSGVVLEGVLRTGVTWEEIHSLASELPADLIVIGTHGRRGLARALLGSVAENVIRTSKVPVLTIHGPREH
jgi:nucleotide-binding universal stress UspA family protein